MSYIYFMKGDEVVVIDGVEGEDEAEVQVDEQGLVEAQVQGEDEAGVVGEMEVVVEGVVDDDVWAEEDDDDSNDYSEVSNSDFEESCDWMEWLDLETFSQSSDPTFDTNKVDSTNSDFDDKDGYSDELDTPAGSGDEVLQKSDFLVLRCLKMMKISSLRTARNSQATPKWVAKRLMSSLMHTLDMKLKALVAYVVEKWGFRLSMDQAYRTKVKAMEKIEGANKDQYKHLRSYAAELTEKNKNNTVKIKCDLTPHGPVFERMYVCLEACKSVFATTCRPLIGLDGCFLKEEYGGQLLFAVGKDGNNQMFPIAYAVVESENYSS
ncbi:uncharacterized protein LOC114408346 [Glycine soja]|uniref:uncharacterized protein LOC114408346 n=1 Tax=Glycine soja TaxID=3848 RepID=UPI00103EA1DB|nr:uncharacterized protein LOC114408346 [Glycine soja]